MALFIFDKTSNCMDTIHSKIDWNTVRYFSSYAQIQKEYCTCIEVEVDDEIPFFENPDVKKYLNDNGVEYLGNYLLYSEKWCPSKQFVTHLHYILQMSCIMLYAPENIYVIEKQSLVEYKYLLPVLKKMDVYLILDDFMDMTSFIEMADGGIELVINGKSTKDMEKRELLSYLIKLEYENSNLNREVDAKYFPADFERTEIFKPYQTSYKEYIIANERENLDRNTNWDLPSDITVIVNGKNEFSGIFRRYPVHYLYEIDGEWKYIHNNSIKYPSLMELFDEIFFSSERFDFDYQKFIEVSKSKKVFVMVLDCNEVCNVKEYWKYVAFVAKYDKELKVIEICDQAKGILEFHKLLQKSTDLHDNESFL